jgi:hypothetical protein
MSHTPYKLKSSYTGPEQLDTKDRALSVIYGRTPDKFGGDLVPIAVDSTGRIVLGSGLVLDVGDLDIGDVRIKGITNPADPVGSEHFAGMTALVDAPYAGLFALLTEDPRQQFVGGALRITPFLSGTIFPEVTTNIVAPAYNSFADVGGTYSVTGFIRKSFVLKNTGANPVDVRGFVSVDGGLIYDIPLLPTSNLNPGGVVWVDDERAFTHFKFQVKRNIVGDSIVVAKGYAA